jgi:hypothetical protein
MKSVLIKPSTTGELTAQEAVIARAGPRCDPATGRTE